MSNLNRLASSQGLSSRQDPMVGGGRGPDVPEYLEIDLVSHNGEVAAVEGIWTLCVTDLSTGWTDRVPLALSRLWSSERPGWATRTQD